MDSKSRSKSPLALLGPLPNEIEWELKEQQELRIEIASDENLQITLTSGSCEIFGVDLVKGKPYLLSNKQIAIFTWYGAKLTTAGNLKVSPYVSSASQMVNVVNFHAQFEAKRNEAMSNGGFGPRVMVVGPSDCGKSTLVRTLLNYSIRLGHSPLFVDIDIGQGEITVPGCFSATQLNRSCLSVEGFKLAAPLVHYYGHTSPNANPELFKSTLKAFSENIYSRLKTDKVTKASGFIINTCGWVEGLGYKLLIESMKIMDVDVVIVMGDEKLHAQLSTETASHVTIGQIPRFGGAVRRSKDLRKRFRHEMISKYFYGPWKNNLNPPQRTLSPQILTLSFDEVEIFRVGPQLRSDIISDNMMILGAKTELGPLDVIPEPIDNNLLHSLLACLYIDGVEGIKDATAAGFVSIHRVDMTERKLYILAPCPGVLPSKYLLVGDITWME